MALSRRDSHVSADYLLELFTAVGPGFSQLSCHPGRPQPGAGEGYRRERELELQALTDPRVKEAVDHAQTGLANDRDYARVAVKPGGGRLARGCGSAVASTPDSPLQKP